METCATELVFVGLYRAGEVWPRELWIEWSQAILGASEHGWLRQMEQGYRAGGREPPLLTLMMVVPGRLPSSRRPMAVLSLAQQAVALWPSPDLEASVAVLGRWSWP